MESHSGETSNLISIALILLRGPAHSLIYPLNSKHVMNTVNSLQVLATFVLL